MCECTTVAWRYVDKTGRANWHVDASKRTIRRDEAKDTVVMNMEAYVKMVGVRNEQERKVQKLNKTQMEI